MDVLYLDICCLKRPFDDQSDARIRAEAAAVADLFERAQAGGIRLVRSPAHRVENDANPREDRRLATALWLDGFARDVQLTPDVEARARTLEGLGFSPLDALHISFAEQAQAAAFVTCDDRLVAKGARHAAELKTRVLSPLDFPRMGA